ncbi:MAG: AEC family transporter [Sulfurimonadaceae bacterium]|jgi:predicted permease|nr:AEC family transporter [Sulfurimonadaceae bacterium]
MNFILVIGIYVFIAIGFIAKKSFRDKIDEKTITILNVYFLQVFLTFWGLLSHPIDIDILVAPSIYLLIVVVVLLLSGFIAKKIFYEQKSYSIATVSAIITNTGNLGIPINIAIFGEASIPYTTMINLANVFIVHTIGVYYYSRGEFSTKESLKNIAKIPILYAAIVALTLSAIGFNLPHELLELLKMGAYASIVMQLVLFGLYLHGIKAYELDIKLNLWVNGVKFLAIPLISFLTLSLFSIDSYIKGIIFMELLMPLAIANVNIASLFECKPRELTTLVFITSLLFLVVVFIGIKVVEFL